MDEDKLDAMIEAAVYEMTQNRLIAAGYDPQAAQNKANELLM